VISTAVLTGALIIGDSIRLSLGKLVETRLGNTRYAIVAGSRLVRSDLARDMGIKLKIPASPLLTLQGIVINPETKDRINSGSVIGFDNSFQTVTGRVIPALGSDEALISENIARQLHLKKGDEFLLRVENASPIPINAPFAADVKPSMGIRLSVKNIVTDENMGRFSLRNNQATPFNVFVSLEFLNSKLNIAKRANVILLSDNFKNSHPKDMLDKALDNVWHAADAGLKIKDLEESGQYEVSSDRIFIEPSVSKGLFSLKLPREEILTYLVNTIRHNTKQTPYSFVAAVSSSAFYKDLQKDDIIVTEWLASDLDVSIGDSITLDYYIIGPLRTLIEKSKRFIVKKVLPTHDNYVNGTLMPDFPGLADAGNCRDWNTSIPIDLKKIRDKDEKFWNEYKGTPKAFISIQAGQELWGNQFGNLTAIRFNKKDISLSDLQNIIEQKIKPRDLGIGIVPVQEIGLQAANNGVDFGELFLSLSFFIIAAGILLTILIYALNTDSRSRETAILSGLGFNKKKIIQMRLTESAVIILLGGVFGSALGILYNYGLLAGLNSVWHDAVRTNNLTVFVLPSTLSTGAITGVVISLISIYLVTLRKLKQPVAVIVKGDGYKKPFKPRRFILSKLLAFVGIIGGCLLASISVIISAYENATLFLSAGGLFLTGTTALIVYLIKKPAKNQKVLPGYLHLALKNAGRNVARSITVVLVLGIGTFSIILTGAYQKTFYGTENIPKSGTGGYALWAETALPVPFDLNSETGKSNLIGDDIKISGNVHLHQLQSLQGDDASCLNLNQVHNPRIIGVDPEEFDKRGSFSFVALCKNINKEHPWLALNNSGYSKVFPAYADQTVIQYGLKKSIGDTLTYLNEQGDRIRFRLCGGLDNSIFQGSLLISAKIFQNQFPSAGGSKIILIDAPQSEQKEISELLSSSLIDFGIDITPAPTRLAEFDSVENTYLTVFMALGGLGFIIGTFGLGIMLFRNMLERRGELSLLITIGYKKQQIFRLVLTENILLLVSGIFCGALSAFIGILPSLLSPSFTIHIAFLGILILFVLIIGLLWIIFLTKHALKGSLIEALREE
jgi:ABC-type antimicrobial peptide transport system permease subunit